MTTLIHLPRYSVNGTLVDFGAWRDEGVGGRKVVGRNDLGSRTRPETGSCEGLGADFGGNKDPLSTFRRSPDTSITNKSGCTPHWPLTNVQPVFAPSIRYRMQV